MKRLLVTGGSGLLALNWAVFCCHQWEIFLCLNRRIIKPSFAKTVFIDLASEILPSEFSKLSIDLVVHCAALTSVEACELNPQLAQFVNVDLAANVASACNILNIPLIHISTDHIFDSDGIPSLENTPPSPLNVYSKTKLEAEFHVSTICSNSLIIRTNFYGWSPSYRRSFSDVILNRISANLPFYGFTDVYYTPIYVADLVDLVMRLFDLSVTGIFHLSGSDCISKYQFAVLLAKIFQYDESLIFPSRISECVQLIQRPVDMSIANIKVCSTLGISSLNLHESLLKLRNHQNEDLILKIRSL